MIRKGTKRRLLITEKGLFDSIEDLVRYIRYAIDVEHMTQEEVANKLGCSPRHIRRYQRTYKIESVVIAGHIKNQGPKDRIDREGPPKPILAWD